MEIEVRGGTGNPSPTGCDGVHTWNDTELTTQRCYEYGNLGHALTPPARRAVEKMGVQIWNNTQLQLDGK